MTPAPTSLEVLHQNRQRVAEFRARARRLFDQGATGIQVAAAISESTEAFLASLYEAVCDPLPAAAKRAISESAAVIAVGGTGRGDLCPWSDLDLLFLYDPATQQPFQDVAGRLVRACWDAGLQVGHAVREVAETLTMARSDAQVATSLAEARLLFGSNTLFEQFQKDVEKTVFRSRFDAFLQMCLDARAGERREHGTTPTHLEPDVKRSLGGLRDVHLLRWIACARYGVTDLETLRRKGVLEKDEARTLAAAYEFLLRVRIDLHFHAGRPQDVLSRDEQRRIAEERGIEPAPGLRPVERFMRDYFRHTTGIDAVVQRFLATHLRPSLARRLVRSLTMHRADRIFRVGGDVIDVAPQHRSGFLRRLEPILRMYCAAALTGVKPEPNLIADIRAASPALPTELSDESRMLFLRILGSCGHLGETLRGMFDTGVLDILVPAVTHARCLLQFNEYHHYTVDEHTLRAVEAIERFAQADGPLGDAYRKIQEKQTLHLAILLHDLGKGFDEDHSEVGLRIAQETAERLNLSPRDGERLAFLVHRHLKMSMIAFRRDLDDPRVILQFAQEVGSPQRLRMLYVLTAADITAVGPGVFTEWKADLLHSLYEKAMQVLSGERHPREAGPARTRITDEVNDAVCALLSGDGDGGLRQRLRGLIDQMPRHYLASIPTERLLRDVETIDRLAAADVVVEGHNDDEARAVEYRIFAGPAAADGCFHKIAGVLTAKRMEILTAQICTASSGVAVDTFRVLDRDFEGEVPEERIADVANAIRSVLAGTTDVRTLFQRNRRYGAAHRRRPVSDLPMRVVMDNETSDRATIIDVFAHDSTGLLYTVTRALHELGLSVTLAKISTYFDQVVDVFYVTETSGERITDPDRLRNIRDELTRRITEFERAEWQQFL